MRIPVGEFINYLKETYSIEIAISNDEWDNTIKLKNPKNKQTAIILLGRKDNTIEWDAIERTVLKLGVIVTLKDMGY